MFQCFGLSKGQRHQPDAVEHGLFLGRWFSNWALGAHNFHWMLLFARLVVLALVKFRLGHTILPQNLPTQKANHYPVLSSYTKRC